MDYHVLQSAGIVLEVMMLLLLHVVRQHDGLVLRLCAEGARAGLSPLLNVQLLLQLQSCNLLLICFKLPLDCIQLVLFLLRAPRSQLAPRR